MRVVAEGVDTTDPSAQQHLARLAEAVKANPLLVYNNEALTKLHLKQLPFHAAKTRVKVYTGGTRAGKSSAGVVDDLIQCLPREMVPDHLLTFKRKDPPFKLRVVTPDLLRTLVGIQDVFRKWTPPSAYLGGSWKEAYSKQDRILSLVGGSKIDFMSYEADLDKFGSVALDRVHFDEEPPGEKGEAIYTQSLRRIVDYQGDIIFTATPEFGLSWTSTEFWDNRGEEVDERVWQNDWLTIVRASTHDNPFVPADALSESRMTEEEYKVKVLGEWFHLKGLVYGDFDFPTHVVEPPKVEHVRSQDIFVGIDPGIVTTGVVFCAFDRDNSMLVFDELYLHDQAAVPRHAAQAIKSKLKMWGIKDAPRYIIDPSARNRNLVTGQNVEAAFHLEGIHVEPGNNEKEAGAFEIKRRLQDTPPTFHVSKTCQKWLWERDRYRMDEKADGSFDTVKKDDHLMDPTRYVAMARQYHLPTKARPKGRPSFGENPSYEPPFRPTSKPETSPMGAYT